LLDLTMPGASGFSGLVYLKGQSPEMPVVVVSGNEDHSVIKRSLEYGALGFIPKSVSLELMVEAIQAALEGDVWIPEGVNLEIPAVNDKEAKIAEGIASLTPQQFRVLVMLMQGLLNKQIAYELDVSEATIKAHVTAILRKLGVHSRTQAVIAARSLDVDSLLSN
jgi:DNA-binding NarL/FixJ family response regulator